MVAISVSATAIMFVIIGILIGLLAMHLCSRKKAVYLPKVKGQANKEPTAPADPVYDEILLKETIELTTNQAYGPVGQHSMI